MADRTEAEPGTGIEVRNLYKIFGARPHDYIDLVRGGMSKTELNEKHHHVVGLRDINIFMPEGGSRSSWGCRAPASRP